MNYDFAKMDMAEIENLLNRAFDGEIGLAPADESSGNLGNSAA